MLKRLSAVLLIGCLSMLFGEVFAGSSRTWFVDPWGLLVTFPLYLGHVLLLLMVALKSNRVSLVSLYCLGMVFALYEAALTKVLWAGYWDSTGEGFGHFAGISLAEFPMLVFFWHPVMSFILPIVAFQWLTGAQLIADHHRFLRFSSSKFLLLIVLAATISSFLASGSGFDPVSANAAFFGSVLLILALARGALGVGLSALVFGRLGNAILIALMIVTYVIWLFLVFPERLPSEPIAYLAIGISYLVAIYLFLRLEPAESAPKVVREMQPWHLLLLIGVYVGSLNYWLVAPDAASSVLAVLYLVLYGAGTLFFSWLIFRLVKNSLLAKRSR
ncbi:hypothetical protein [Maritalea porphyrae]|uniref:Uncharacterized protein n=1 Tax=Maritalea porphyrae TaxID=880732 RepID=A0ABQ5UVV2_9HYPH|nr:hypothetical protein [Maritalea porphyrae]GLQ18539.1 hypothetical protein GCM10007879_27880 [Maritalea porphyrae]